MPGPFFVVTRLRSLRAPVLSQQSQAGTRVIGIPVGAAAPSISGGQPPTGTAPQ